MSSLTPVGWPSDDIKTTGLVKLFHRKKKKYGNLAIGTVQTLHMLKYFSLIFFMVICLSIISLCTGIQKTKLDKPANLYLTSVYTQKGAASPHTGVTGQ